MVLNIIIWVILAAVSGLVGWLAWRAWHSTKALVQWVGGILSSVLTLVLGAVSVVALIGLVKFYSPRKAAVPDMQISATSQQVARGQYLAGTMCASCHSPSRELPLAGGVDLGQDFPMNLGTFVSANLTPGGPLKDWSDGEIFRALRNGVDRKGRGLVIMSVNRVRNMSDADLQAVIAYLRSQPAIADTVQDPPDQPNFLAVLLQGAGKVPEGLAPIEGVIVAPPAGPTRQYGEYIVGYQDCRDCHGEDLHGGTPGQIPPVGPDLAEVKYWTQEQFITALRTGMNPSGHMLNDQMPWKVLGRMTDDDLAAVYAYLSELP
jgi:mono/diheme cytochrome c family protein